MPKKTMSMARAPKATAASSTEPSHARPTAKTRLSRSLYLAIACLTVGLSGLAHAGSAPLTPQTRLRLTVVQWMPTKGVYEQWAPLGGEFVVSEAGTIALPVIGAVPVGDLDNEELAARIATLLQQKIGLVNKPDTTVEILEYPPIYVVGDVNAPGEHKFRTGLTVLQALALSGGQFRNGEASAGEQTRLVGELRGADDEILRSTARMARLQAEMSGAKEISFPQTSIDSASAETAPEIYAQERILFTARANELSRQTKSLGELRDLLTAEINVLQEKIKATDDNIKASETELGAVTQLVDKGIATASRKTDLERVLSGYRTERLDQVTAVMRARQGITEATRNMDGLRDKLQTEIASELQTEQGKLEQLRLKRGVSQRLLLDALAAPGSSIPGRESALTYTITRQEAGEARQLAAQETTALQPGDVVKVTYAQTPSNDLAPLLSQSVSDARTVVAEGVSR